MFKKASPKAKARSVEAPRSEAILPPATSPEAQEIEVQVVGATIIRRYDDGSMSIGESGIRFGGSR